MIRTFRWPLLLSLLAFGALALAACGDDDDDDGDSAPAPAATQAPAATAAAVEASTVNVTMIEWSMEVDQPGAPGEVTFVVENAGEVPHEFAVVRTDLDAGDLPTAAAGVDETAVEVVGRIAQFDTGTEETTLTLEAGSYALICNLPGHYTLGMLTSFTVE